MRLIVRSKTGFIALAIHTVLVAFIGYGCGMFTHLNNSLSGEAFFQFFFATIFDFPIYIIWQLVVLVPGLHYLESVPTILVMWFILGGYMWYMIGHWIALGIWEKKRS